MKKDDQIGGDIPFVMAGITNTGIANYISNPVASFPKNSITIDIFGNTFYRDYSFGAGDDTGVYWNSEKEYSVGAMKFISIAMSKAVHGRFDFGKKLRSSQSLNFKMQLPIKNGEIDFNFMESCIAELELEQVKRLEEYLSVTDLKNYTLSNAEKQALTNYDRLDFDDFKVVNIFDVKNTRNILSRDIVEDSGVVPYLCASAENNSVSSYISYNENFIDKGNCVFIGGKTFVVSYQEKDFYSNDSHNLALYLKDEEKRNELNQLFLATCVDKSLKHKYSWGDSISNQKIQKDFVALPVKHNHPDFEGLDIFMSAVQKLVIKDVVLYVEGKKKELNKPTENNSS